MATEVEVAGTALQTGTTQTLFDLRSDATVYMFDIANDGRILALLNDRRDVMPIHLVTNWPSLLQRPQ